MDKSKQSFSFDAMLVEEAESPKPAKVTTVSGIPAKTPAKNGAAFVFPSSFDSQDPPTNEPVLKQPVQKKLGLSLSVKPGNNNHIEPEEQAKTVHTTATPTLALETGTTILAPPVPKKKRELNLFLPVAIIEKQEKEIPLPTDGNSQKKKKDVFNFYDNFHEFTVFCDVAMKKCSRENQEDRFSAISPLDTINNTDAFFAVFDGHGTSVIAETLKEHLHTYILKNPLYHTNITQAIKQSFSLIDEEILQKQKDQVICSGGSTALCCLIKEDTLYIINCGDSSSVLVSSNTNHTPPESEYAVQVLNKLHKPNSKEEQARLISQNTLFTERRVIGSLAVTRALGDYKHKEYIISEPDITEYKINPEDKYLFLGTDGFWDIIDYEKDLPGLLKERERNSHNNPNNTNTESIKELSTFLVEIASNRTTNQKKDNMTLLAIDLNWFYRYNFERDTNETGFLSSTPVFEEQSNQKNSFFTFNNNNNNSTSNTPNGSNINDNQMISMSAIMSNNNNNEPGIKEQITKMNSSTFVMCSKSEFRINTEISSFLFQAKSPHSVGRGIEKQRSSMSSSLNKSKNSAVDDSLNSSTIAGNNALNSSNNPPPTCSKKPQQQLQMQQMQQVQQSQSNQQTASNSQQNKISLEENPSNNNKLKNFFNYEDEDESPQQQQQQQQQAKEIDELDELIQSQNGQDSMTTSNAFFASAIPPVSSQECEQLHSGCTKKKEAFKFEFISESPPKFDAPELLENAQNNDDSFQGENNHSQDDNSMGTNKKSKQQSFFQF